MFQVEEMLLAKVFIPVILFTLRLTYNPFRGLGARIKRSAQRMRRVWLGLLWAHVSFVFPTDVSRGSSPLRLKLEVSYFVKGDLQPQF